MATTLITFDSGDTSGYALVDFGGSSSSVASTPPTGASGQAVMVTKGAAGTPSEGWAGTTFLSLGSSEMITTADKTVTMKVWSPDAGTVVRLKLEDKAYVETYVHTLTHELKSPLAAIRGAVEGERVVQGGCRSAAIGGRIGHVERQCLPAARNRRGGIGLDGVGRIGLVFELQSNDRAGIR